MQHIKYTWPGAAWHLFPLFRVGDEWVDFVHIGYSGVMHADYTLALCPDTVPILVTAA